MFRFKIEDLKKENFNFCGKNSSTEIFNKLIKKNPESSKVNKDSVQSRGINAFIDAAFTAYSYHLPLNISPDDIWLCITQGLARHINKNSEELRKQFVNFEGKKEIKIETDSGFQKGQENDWQDIFPQFSERIKEYVGKKTDLFISNFSTTEPMHKIASEIVLMDAMQSYFEFTCRTCCGIPEVNLLGTVEDWKEIKNRAQVLSEFNCDFWLNDLVPVLDQLIATAEGNPDLTMWKEFFKEGGGSGGPFVSGWINVFFPYRKYGKGDFCQNINMRKSRLNLDDFPSSLSKVPFKWEYYDQEFKMEFYGGAVGIAQEQDESISVAYGWAVAEEG